MNDEVRKRRQQWGRISALRMHSRGQGNSGPGRAAFLSSFEREVDPEGKLSPAERSRRASQARKAYFLELALKSAQARARRRSRNADDGPGA